MRATTHLAFALAVATPVAGAWCGQGDECRNLLSEICWYLVGAIFPDIDEPRSYIGRRLWFFSWPLRILTSHREATHSIAFVFLLSVLLYMFFSSFGMSIIDALAFLAGNLIHMAGDMATKGGCPIFFPLSMKRFFVLPQFMRFRTGSLTEYFWAILFLSIFLWALFFNSILLN